MKKAILLSLLGLASFCALAQEKKESKKVVVPEAVKQAFAKKFPSAQKVEWSLESATEFEAEFKNNGVKTAANFDQAGKWIVTETEIKSSELPVAIQAVLKKEYIGYKVEEVEKAETAANEVFYEVGLEKGKSDWEIKFAADGKIIKKEEKKEGKGEKD